MKLTTTLKLIGLAVIGFFAYDYIHGLSLVDIKAYEQYALAGVIACIIQPWVIDQLSGDF